MELNKNYYLHFTLSVILFFLGEGMVILPTASQKNGFISGFIISAVLGGVLLVSIYLLADFCLTNRFFSALLYLSAAVLSLFSAGECFKIFIRFADDLMLISGSTAVAIIIFALCIFYFLSKDTACLFKFAVIISAVLLLLALMLFLLDRQKFEISKLKTAFTNPFNTEKAIPFLKVSILPTLATVPYASAKKCKKPLFSGYIFSVLTGFVLLCFIAMLFGGGFSAADKYPFCSAVSTVSVGRLFTRLDGFAFFICFAICLFKTVACFKICKFSLLSLNKSLTKQTLTI